MYVYVGEEIDNRLQQILFRWKPAKLYVVINQDVLRSNTGTVVLRVAFIVSPQILAKKQHGLIKMGHLRSTENLKVIGHAPQAELLSKK